MEVKVLEKIAFELVLKGLTTEDGGETTSLVVSDSVPAICVSSRVAVALTERIST